MSHSGDFDYNRGIMLHQLTADYKSCTGTGSAQLLLSPGQPTVRAAALRWVPVFRPTSRQQTQAPVPRHTILLSEIDEKGRWKRVLKSDDASSSVGLCPSSARLRDLFGSDGGGFAVSVSDAWNETRGLRCIGMTVTAWNIAWIQDSSP